MTNGKRGVEHAIDTICTAVHCHSGLWQGKAPFTRRFPLTSGVSVGLLQNNTPGIPRRNRQEPIGG